MKKYTKEILIISKESSRDAGKNKGVQQKCWQKQRSTADMLAVTKESSRNAGLKRLK